MANKAVEILLKAKDLASNVVGKVERSVANLAIKSGLAKPKVDGFAKANEQAAVSTDKLGHSLGGTVAKITAFLSVTYLFAKVKELFLGVTSTGTNFETLQTQLDAVTGSAKAGEQALAWIKEFAKDTPLQLNEVTEGFVKLKAFGIDPMNGSYQAIVDQTSKLGGGQEKLNGIILAVGQAWAKQKLQAEETLQLVERGVPVYDLLSKALGKTAAEIQDMSANGELGRDAIKALIDEMGSSSLGAAAAQMEDMSGIWSNLKDIATEFLDEIADQGVLNYFKSQLKDLTATIKEMAADGSLKSLAKDISDGMIRMAEATKTVIGTIIRFSGELKALAVVIVSVKVGKLAANMLSLSTNMLITAKSANVLRSALISTGYGAIAVAIGYVASKLLELNEISASAARNQAQLAEQQREVDAVYADLSERLGIQIKNSRDLIEAEKEGLIVFDEKTKRYEKVGEASKNAADAEDDYTKMLKRFNAEMANNANQTQINIHSTEAFAQKLKEVTAEGDSLADVLADMTDNEFNRFAQEAAQFANSGFADEVESAAVQVAVFDEQMKRAGVDLELFRSGMTTAGKAAIDNWKSISESATASNEITLAAFESTLSKLKNRREFDAIKESFLSWAKTAKLTSKQITDELDKISEAARKANSDLQSMLQDISAADAIEDLNKLAFAAADSMTAGKISAQEYLDLMSELDDKRADIIKKTEHQADKEQLINDKLKERKGLLDETGKQQKQNNTDSEQANSIRSVAIQQTERQATAMQRATKALKGQADQINSTASYFKYLRNVESLSKKYVEASENAEKLADGVKSIDNGARVSEGSLRNYIHNLQSAIAGGEELDKQTLSKLQNALSAAKSKMQSLKSETKSAASEVAGLESELASLNGNQARVQQLEYQQKRLDIEEKIAAAKQSGNGDAEKDYRRSLQLLDRINAQKLRTIREEQTASTNVPPTTPQQAKSSDKTTLEFKDPSGNTVSGEFERDDAAKVMKILKNAGARTV